jgi:protein-disulfide isomerase
MTDPRTPRRLWSRRNVVAVGVLAAAFGARELWQGRAAPLTFREVSRPAGFRWLMRGGGGAQSAAALFAGLDTPATPTPDIAPGDLCAWLFGGAAALNSSAGAASMAVFTDLRCPYCKVLTTAAQDLAARAPDRVRLSVHDWPALGPTSERMARVALAAGRQGAWRPMHDLLSATRFVPNGEWIARNAENLGLSAPRLIADMNSPEVDATLARTAAMARALGFDGTPGIVIGRTIAEGALPPELLERLVEMERAAGPPPGCG